MYRSRNRPNDVIRVGNSTGENRIIHNLTVTPPQDISVRFDVRESLTMYSRPTAFGPPSWGGGTGSFITTAGTEYVYSGSDSMSGYNFPYTPPYYYGEAWCHLMFKATENRKHSVSEIMASASLYPYYTRFYWPGESTAMRDLTGGGALRASGYFGVYRRYLTSPWKGLWDLEGYSFNQDRLVADDIRKDMLWMNTLNDAWGSIPGGQIKNYPPPPTASIQHPFYLDYNAMQLDSSVNLFGKAIKRSVDLSTDASSERVEVFTDATNEAKTQWVIQPKFETPILNFNKYSTLGQQGCTLPSFASASVPRGMWHQYGEIPTDPATGVFLQVEDIPATWFAGNLAIAEDTLRDNVKSLADLCGFDKKPIKLGVCGEVKEISEAVVAVPFVQRRRDSQVFLHSSTRHR